MEAKILQGIFIKTLRSELCETELDGSVKEQITTDQISALYKLSKFHDLAHVVSSSLRKYRLINHEKLTSEFNREEIMSVYRYERMKYTYDQICHTFDEHAIPYIPLKGAVIRPYYPKESMRTSCDIDILVKEEDLKSAIDALIQKGFRCKKRNYHDVSMFSPMQVHLELHFSIRENSENVDRVLKDAWKHAVQVDGYRYEFSKEFFMYYFFAHLSYHFLSGGCGIRPLMDIWIIEHKMGITYRDAEALLKKAGIYKFAEEISNLVAVCFSDKPADDLTDTLLSYIFSNGVYGTMQSAIVAKRQKEKNYFSFLLHRILMPYKDMTVIFPILKKAPVLLPFCWIIRAFMILFSGRARSSISEMLIANNVSEDRIETIRYIKKKLDL